MQMARPNYCSRHLFWEGSIKDEGGREVEGSRRGFRTVTGLDTQKERRNKTGGASNCSTTESLCQSPSKDFASEVCHVGFKILRHWLGAASGEHCHAEPCHSDNGMPPCFSHISVAVPSADLLIGHLSCHCYPIHVCISCHFNMGPDSLQTYGL